MYDAQIRFLNVEQRLPRVEAFIDEALRIFGEAHSSEPVVKVCHGGNCND